MVDFKGLVGKFIISGIFMFALMSLIIIGQNDNSAEQPLAENSIFNESFSGLNLTIMNATQEADEKYSVFNEENPKPGFGSIVLFGIVSVGKTFSNIIFGFFVSIIKLPLIVFGLPQTIYSLIITWLTITVIVVVWLLYKLGS